MEKPDQRPVLLLNWNYYRADTTEPLLRLAGHFELVFLHDYNTSDNKGAVPEFKRIFWNDFKSPYDLLSEVKPFKIIFYDVESFHQVALVIAARNLKVPTVVLEHGLRGGYEINIEIEKYNRGKSKRSVASIAPNHGARQVNRTLSFYLKSIRARNITSLYRILLFIYFRKKYGLTYGLFKIKKKFRWADLYINFTERNSSYIQVRDGVPLQRFRYTGNPSFDYFFRKTKNFTPSPGPAYLLLLDAPFVEGDVFGMLKEEKISFIKKLNDYALKNKLLLRIKLHPISYHSDYFYRHDNIIYHEVDDIADLILNAQACVHVHLSSLVPVAVLYKPFLFFNTYPEYNEYIKELEIPVYNYFDFSPDSLKLYTLDDSRKEMIIEHFLYNTDGRSFERILRVLQKSPSA